MEPEAQRAALAAAIMERGASLAELSRILGRNPAYLQQYLHRGSPRELSERDRARLAAYLGIAEVRLGGPGGGREMASVARLNLAASAGPGGLVGGAARQEGFAFPPAFLRRLGIRPEAASMIRVSGDSMMPILADGDEVLVDRDRRRIERAGEIFVLRVEDELLVKRLRRVVGGIALVSENPAYPPRIVGGDRIDVIGRVVWLGRVL